MIKTTDLCDELGERARVLAPVFVDLGGKRDFQGRAVTVKCFEDNSRVKELSTQPGQGKVLVIDGGGSERCALFGDHIAEDLARNGWAVCWCTAMCATRPCCRGCLWRSRPWA